MTTLSANLRRMAAASLFVVFASLFGHAQQESILYNFSGGLDGSSPSAVIRDSSTGVFYGTAFIGGCGGAGTVYKVSPGGELTVIHCFADQSPFGGVPGSALVRDSSGTLYGSTTEGGRFDACTDFGCGTVFKVNPDPPFNFTVLHKFSGLSNDGLLPNAIMIDSAGNLFGTAFGGGTFGCGIVFKIDISRKFSVLYNFTCGADGGEPVQGLVQDAAGNLYGVTEYGGTFNAGVVFKISGHSETVLYNFTGGSDGGFPEGYDGHLILDAAGNLYGTTSFAGTFNRTCGNGCGVIFELSPSGAYTVLHSFTGGGDGYSPRQSLLRTKSGTIYGTSLNVAFKLAPSGTFTVLHDFVGGANDGTKPNGSLIIDSAGVLYGSTEEGGTGCCNGVGVIFKISK
ncbi:MAG TPA: choice-of-anchor tandem repeat GloVer-containing protein [Candidatus Dormibacteraeota bacterium]|nr:choice-of-anchor tandem repeat GloVer-containing protein [Candidatus Dormibacteraeota bacterium]